MRPSIRFVELALVAALVAAVIISWQADRRDRAQLAAQKQSNLTTAQLLQTLPQVLGLPAPFSLQPGQGTAPPQAVARPSRGEDSKAFPSVASAQKGTAPQPPTDKSTGLPDNPSPKPANPNALIPSADLKPLYDFALDCRACQAKLAAAQNDLADEKTKSAALTKQRDDAIRAAKGGSALRRIVRAAKWFALGAAAGAIAAKTAR